MPCLCSVTSIIVSDLSVILLGILDVVSVRKLTSKNLTFIVSLPVID